MTSTTETPRNVAEQCSHLVNEHFNKHPFKKVELESFTASSENATGPLASLLKAPIPAYSDRYTSTCYPTLMLHDLQNETHKETAVYKFIDESKDICSGLYGTPGAGKTRAIYEYLSHNYGMYFVASNTHDFGSKDLERLVDWFQDEHFGDRLDKVKVDSQTEDHGRDLLEAKLAQSEFNYANMERYVMFMVYIRRVVFDAINKQLRDRQEETLTPHEWLLVQLFPERAFHGKDLFESVFLHCRFLSIEKRDDRSVVNAITENKEWEENWPLMVVDEAHCLLDSLSGFFLGDEGRERHSAFSGVLRAMKNILELVDAQEGFPLVAGKRLSMDEIDESSYRIRVSMSPRFRRESVFKAFEPLSVEQVKKYLLSFLALNLDDSAQEAKGHVPNSRVIDHVAKWLRGRPRWPAAFLQRFLREAREDDHVGTRGSFSPEGALLIQALDGFLDYYTKASRGRSICRAIKEVIENNHCLRLELESAIFQFAVGGKAAYVDGKYPELIETGVAAWDHTGHRYVLDEPIFIQAGISVFSEMATNGMTCKEGGGLGEGFEKVLLQGIQRKFSDVLGAQLGQGMVASLETTMALKKARVPQRSAYGMLALQCDCPRDTIQWIGDATNSTLEGEVAPFCYPDKNIGPDLIFLMWNDDYDKYFPVISQAKHREKFDQAEALRTITPDLLYHENRGKQNEKLSRVITSDMDLKSRWEEAKPKLVGEEHGCVRLMVHYPSYEPDTVASGVLEDWKTEVEASDLATVGGGSKRDAKEETADSAKEGGGRKRTVRSAAMSRKKSKDRKLGWLLNVTMEKAEKLFGQRDWDVY